jgi:outer membrane immunogenic protein
MVHHDSKPVEDMMKNFLPGFALVALVAAGPAMAADLAPTYKAARVATPFSWSGFYFGGTVGGGMASLPLTDMDDFEGNNFGGQALKSAGWVGGVHAGYNWQFAPSFLFGLEGRLQLVELQGEQHDMFWALRQ